MKLVFADYFPWEYGMQIGNNHYARLFNEDGNTVVWLSHFVNYNRLIRRNDDDRAFIKEWRLGLHQKSDGVWCLTPMAWVPHVDAPFFRSAWVGRNSLKWTTPSIPRSLAKLDARSPDVAWVGIPRLASLIRCVKNAKSVVYRMCDLHTGFAGNPKVTEELESELCRKSSIVFATAHALVKRARQWSDNVVYLPNGVDIERFKGGPWPEPEDLAEIPGPRVLYVGTISDYVDLATVGKTAELLPDVSFVIVGGVRSAGSIQAKVQSELDKITALPNVYHLGFKPSHTVPAYMSNCDVGMIPFISNEMTNAVSPIKIFEYAAAGMSVVSRNLEETFAQSGDHSFYYQTAQDFAEMVEKAVSVRDSNRSKMLAFAEENTWNARYQQILQSLAEIGITGDQ